MGSAPKSRRPIAGRVTRATIVAALPVVSLLGCGEDAVPSVHGDSCFTGLIALCSRPFVPTPTDPRDPTLGVCMKLRTVGFSGGPDLGSYDATYRYNDKGQIDDIATECGVGEPVHIAFEENANGDVARSTIPIEDVPPVYFPPGWEVHQRFFYNDEGALTEVSGRTAAGMHDDWWVRTSNGRIDMIAMTTTGTTSFGGDQELYAYDGDHLSTITSVDTGIEGGPYATTTFTYQPDGHLMSKVLEASAYRNEHTYTWDGDQLRQSTNQTFTEPEDTSSWKVTFHYTYEGELIAHEETSLECFDPDSCGDAAQSDHFSEDWDYDDQGRPVHLVWTHTQD
jgi:hypothetical protein